MPNIKYSYGIICCRPHKLGVQIMMVKKSTTYHFCEFVAGHYCKNNERHIIKLFNNMTYHEKMDILSMNFNIMWYRIYRENPDKAYMQGTHNRWASSYIKKKSKFESTFMQDGGARLKRLIGQSINVDTEWEFPKGRKNSSDEPNITTASREFCEETGLVESQFKILWRVSPYISTYNDFGTTYKNTFYYAEAVGVYEPKYKFYSNHQISEISAVRWINKNELIYMNLESVTYIRLLNCFEKIIKKIKNHTNRIRCRSIIRTGSTIIPISKHPPSPIDPPIRKPTPQYPPGLPRPFSYITPKLSYKNVVKKSLTS